MLLRDERMLVIIISLNLLSHGRGGISPDLVRCLNLILKKFDLAFPASSAPQCTHLMCSPAFPLPAAAIPVCLCRSRSSTWVLRSGAWTSRASQPPPPAHSASATGLAVGCFVVLCYCFILFVVLCRL
jgi:hypothetical protein